MQINLKDVSYIYNEKTPYEKEVLNNIKKNNILSRIIL